MLLAVTTMYDQQIKLIAVTKSPNDYGDQKETTVERTVFAELISVGMAEFYKAKALGLNPELKFKLPDYLEYKGEKLLKFQDHYETEEQTYSIIRTYRVGNELEITCKRGVE